MHQAQDRWSKSAPGVMKIWSASSLRMLMECPRKFWYRYVRGIGTDDLREDKDFGKWVHAGLQEYARRVLDGVEHDAAVKAALVATLFQSGREERLFVCAECGLTEPDSDQTTCPKCGAVRSTPPKPVWRPWHSENKRKNIRTLIRTLVWALDTFKGSNIMPYAWADGTAAIEDRFVVALPRTTPDGDPYRLQGFTDRFARLGADGKILPVETKTTRSTLGQGFFGRYAFDIQVDVYSLVMRMLDSEREVVFAPGVVLEGVQVAEGFSRARRQVITPSKDQLDEFLETILWWIGEAERYAREEYWPMNRANCNNFRKDDVKDGAIMPDAHGGCPYRGICDKARSVRETYMRI